MDPLELRRVPSTGQAVVCAWSPRNDPLHALDRADLPHRLHRVVAAPSEPPLRRRVEWGFVPLHRVLNLASWRHRYSAGAPPQDGVYLGAAARRERAGDVPLTLGGDGRLSTPLLPARPLPRSVSELARWSAAPVSGRATWRSPRWSWSPPPAQGAEPAGRAGRAHRPADARLARRGNPGTDTDGPALQRHAPRYWGPARHALGVGGPRPGLRGRRGTGHAYDPPQPVALAADSWTRRSTVRPTSRGAPGLGRARRRTGGPDTTEASAGTETGAAPTIRTGARNPVAVARRLGPPAHSSCSACSPRWSSTWSTRSTTPSCRCGSRRTSGRRWPRRSSSTASRSSPGRDAFRVRFTGATTRDASRSWGRGTRPSTSTRPPRR